MDRACPVRFRLCNKSVWYAGWRLDMIIDATVFVVHDQECGIGPEIGVIADRAIDRCDELFTCSNIMVWMLVASDQLS